MTFFYYIVMDSASHINTYGTPGIKKAIFLPNGFDGTKVPIFWRTSHSGWGLRCSGAIPHRMKSPVIIAQVTLLSRSSVSRSMAGRRASS